MTPCTIICATNRPNNKTQKVVDTYCELLTKNDIPYQLLTMDALPVDFIFNSSFGKKNQQFETVVDKYISSTGRFVVISPEYNGSFPGVFKAFLDALDPSLFDGAKVGLVGVSTGRAGNLRGMDHLSDIFHHLNATVMPFKLPISRLNEFLIEGDLAESEQKRLTEHIKRFQSF